MASIGVKLYFWNVSEVLYCVTIEEWKGCVCVCVCLEIITRRGKCKC